MAVNRKDKDIVAFISNMSPSKQSSVRMSLQVGPNAVKKAICFDLSKLATFKKKHLSGEPVKIANCMVQEPSNKNFAAIIINSKSRLYEPQPNDIQFERTEQKLEITNIGDIGREMVGHLVSVKGKLKIENKVRIIQSSYNSTDSKISSDNVIADETAMMQFTLWDHWIQLFQDKSG